MKILITGGFGFVGGALGKYLYSKGHEILLGSRSVRQAPDWCPEAIPVITSWTDMKSLVKVCQGVNCIIHAAGMNARDCSNDSVEAIVANGLNTARLLQAAKSAGVQKLIYISTAHVYSSSLSGIITEDACPTNLHPYAMSHRIGEDSVLYANQSGKIKGIVFRLSNAFGVPACIDTDAWILLVNDICRQSVIDSRIVLRSGGKQYRDFVCLNTVVQTIGNMVEFDDSDKLGGVFNLGSGESLSVLEMAGLVATRFKQLFGRDVLIQKEDINEKNYQNLRFSIDKITSTGLYVHSDLVKGIDELLQFCQRNFTTNDTK